MTPRLATRSATKLYEPRNSVLLRVWMLSTMGPSESSKHFRNTLLWWYETAKRFCRQRTKP